MTASNSKTGLHSNFNLKADSKPLQDVRVTFATTSVKVHLLTTSAECLHKEFAQI